MNQDIGKPQQNQDIGKTQQNQDIGKTQPAREQSRNINAAKKKDDKSLNKSIFFPTQVQVEGGIWKSCVYSLIMPCMH